jgi:DNA-directed RNA polymerase subunit RPC12/RpoP
MFECFTCERQFFDFDVQTDEFGGKKAVCPYCGGDIIDIRECKICGELCNDDELHNDVCDGCLYEYRFDTKGLMELYKATKEKVEINAYIASYFSSSQIEEILQGVILANEEFLTINNREFIESDMDYMAQLILEKGKNNE